MGIDYVETHLDRIVEGCRLIADYRVWYYDHDREPWRERAGERPCTACASGGRPTELQDNSGYRELSMR